MLSCFSIHMTWLSCLLFTLLDILIDVCPTSGTSFVINSKSSTVKSLKTLNQTIYQNDLNAVLFVIPETLLLTTNSSSVGGTQSIVTSACIGLSKEPEDIVSFTARAKMNNLINVISFLYVCMVNTIYLFSLWKYHVNLLLQSFRSVSSDLHQLFSCSRSTTIVQSLLTTINKLFSSTIVSSCSNNTVTSVVFCQHRTTTDRTILINIVNSTSVVEP